MESSDGAEMTPAGVIPAAAPGSAEPAKHELSGEGGAASSSAVAMPPAGAPVSAQPAEAEFSVEGGGSSSSTCAMPQAGLPQSLQPPEDNTKKGTTKLPSSSKASREEPSDDAADEVVNEPVRPKENPKLTDHQIKALHKDDFLLGMDLEDAKQPDQGDAVAVDETFAKLDVALKKREFNVAEALWKHMVTVGAAAVIPDRPELRAIASRYVSAMCPRIQDELEDAIERKDVNAAEREHQRLKDLRETCRETRIDMVDTSLDRSGRNAELEARYQQLCSKNSALVCNLFPRVNVNGCMVTNSNEACILL
jgi:hypothetical protein